MSSQIRVDSISNLSGDGSVELTYGATIPSGQKLQLGGNINIAGVSTVGFLSATNVNVSGIVTATTFVGDGSGLTAVPTVSASKSIALSIIGS